MEKQIRQLSSLKTLKEMRGTSGRTTEELRFQKLASLKYRQSVPVKNASPTRLQKSVNPSSDIKVQIISSQLKMRKEEILSKTSELEELECRAKSYYNEILQLKDENSKLRDNIRVLQFETAGKKLDERESLVMPSLFDELQLVSEVSHSDNLSSKPINFTILNNGIPTKKQPLEFADSATQTSKTRLSKDKSKEKQRGCFSCF
jgi:hypothetical protein